MPRTAQQTTPSRRPLTRPATEAPEKELDGHDILAEWEMPGDYLNAHVKTPSNLRIIRVAGDSMEPEYMAGERVLVDITHRIPSPSGIYMVWNGYGSELKRLSLDARKGNHVLTVSTPNHSYAAYECQPSDILITGRVVGRWVWK